MRKQQRLLLRSSWFRLAVLVFWLLFFKADAHSAALAAESSLPPSLFEITLPAQPRYEYLDDAFSMEYQLLEPDGTPAVGVPYSYEVVMYNSALRSNPNDERIQGYQLIGPIGNIRYGVTGTDGSVTLEQVNDNNGNGMMVNKLRIGNLGKYAQLSWLPETGSSLTVQNEYVREMQFSAANITLSILKKYLKLEFLETLEGSSTNIGYDYQDNFLNSRWTGLDINDPDNFINKEWPAHAYSIMNTYTAANEPIKLFYRRPYVEERFVDEAGNELTPPAGHSQNQQTTYERTPFQHQTAKLPNSYMIDGESYVYQGCKTGTTFIGASSLTYQNPVELAIEQMQAMTIFLVYKKGEPVTVTASYCDESGIELPGVARTTATIAAGDSYTGAPAAQVTDSLGNQYRYVGWLLGDQQPGPTVTPSSEPVELTVTADQMIKYIYRLEPSAGELSLKPSHHSANSGEVISWTAEIKNTSQVSMKGLQLSRTLSDFGAAAGLKYQADSTKINGSSVSDTIWQSGTTVIEELGAGQLLTIEFATTVLGTPNQVLEAELTAAGNFETLSATAAVRLKDADHPSLETDEEVGLLTVPQQFIFETAVISPTVQEKSLQIDAYSEHTQTNGFYVRLFDKRQEQAGWRLNLQLTQFQSSSDQLPAAAAIKMSGLTLQEVINQNTDRETCQSISSDRGPQFTDGSQIEIPSDGTAVQLLQALPDSDKGVWQLGFSCEAVTLKLPGNVGRINEVYSSKLSWMMIDAF